MDDKYYSTHCASCGKKDPPLTKIYCGECWHPYLIPMVGLYMHDWLDGIRFQFKTDMWLYLMGEGQKDKHWKRKRVKYFLKSLIPGIYGKVKSCPCCAHDL